MFERLTDRARKAMALANQEAQRFNHEYIGTEHILLGLVREDWGVAAIVLKNLDIDLTKLRKEVERLVQTGDVKFSMGKLPQTPRAKKVIEYAIEEARSLNHSHVGTEHLLLGLLREGQGIAWRALETYGLTIERVRAEVMKVLTERGDDDGLPAGLTEPFELPDKLAIAISPNHRDFASLTDVHGKQVSPEMRIELAKEIVKRWNAG
jgi:ATP-dependent Clp protease ATP-binding subunit ClpC